MPDNISKNFFRTRKDLDLRDAQALSKKGGFDKALENAKNIEIFASELEGKNKEEFVEKLKGYGISEDQATALFKTANTDGDDIISKKESLDFANISKEKNDGVFNAADLKVLLNAAEEAINAVSTDTDNLTEGLRYATTGGIVINPVDTDTGAGNAKAFGRNAVPGAENGTTSANGEVAADKPVNTSGAENGTSGAAGNDSAKAKKSPQSLYPGKRSAETSGADKSGTSNGTKSADKAGTPSTQANKGTDKTNGTNGVSKPGATGASTPGKSALEEFGISPTTISDALNNPTNDPARTGFPGNASGLGGNYGGYPGGGGYPSAAQGYGGAAGNGGNSGGFWDKVANGLSSLGSRASTLTNTISSLQGSFTAGMSPSMQTYFMGQAMQNMSSMFSGLFGAGTNGTNGNYNTSFLPGGQGVPNIGGVNPATDLGGFIRTIPGGYNPGSLFGNGNLPGFNGNGGIGSGNTATGTGGNFDLNGYRSQVTDLQTQVDNLDKNILHLYVKATSDGFSHEQKRAFFEQMNMLTGQRENLTKQMYSLKDAYDYKLRMSAASAYGSAMSNPNMQYAQWLSENGNGSSMINNIIANTPIAKPALPTLPDIPAAGIPDWKYEDYFKGTAFENSSSTSNVSGAASSGSSSSVSASVSASKETQTVNVPEGCNTAKEAFEAIYGIKDPGESDPEAKKAYDKALEEFLKANGLNSPDAKITGTTCKKPNIDGIEGISGLRQTSAIAAKYPGTKKLKGDELKKYTDIVDTPAELFRAYYGIKAPVENDPQSEKQAYSQALSRFLEANGVSNPDEPLKNNITKCLIPGIDDLWEKLGSLNVGNGTKSETPGLGSNIMLVEQVGNDWTTIGQQYLDRALGSEKDEKIDKLFNDLKVDTTIDPAGRTVGNLINSDKEEAAQIREKYGAIFDEFLGEYMRKINAENNLNSPDDIKSTHRLAIPDNLEELLKLIAEKCKSITVDKNTTLIDMLQDKDKLAQNGKDYTLRGLSIAHPAYKLENNADLKTVNSSAGTVLSGKSWRWTLGTTTGDDFRKGFLESGSPNYDGEHPEETVLFFRKFNEENGSDDFIKQNDWEHSEYVTGLLDMIGGPFGSGYKTSSSAGMEGKKGKYEDLILYKLLRDYATVYTKMKGWSNYETMKKETGLQDTPSMKNFTDVLSGVEEEVSDEKLNKLAAVILYSKNPKNEDALWEKMQNSGIKQDDVRRLITAIEARLKAAEREYDNTQPKQKEK